MCSMHVLRPFKYKIMCELCDNIQDKDKRVILIGKKFCVLREEFIYLFHDKFYILTIEKLQFLLSSVIILVSME